MNTKSFELLLKSNKIYTNIESIKGVKVCATRSFVLS